MLGDAFNEVFSSENNIRCTDIDVNADWLEYLDFRKYDKYKEDVDAFRPDYLFHLGAYTNLEY